MKENHPISQTIFGSTVVDIWYKDVCTRPFFFLSCLIFVLYCFLWAEFVSILSWTSIITHSPGLDIIFWQELNRKGLFVHNIMWHSLFLSLSVFPTPRGGPLLPNLDKAFSFYRVGRWISCWCSSSKLVVLYTDGCTSAKYIVECHIVQSVYCQHFRHYIWHWQALVGINMLLLSFYALNILECIWGTLQFPCSSLYSR